MKKLFNFRKFIIEKVQTDWFEKNPEFYLSKNKKYIQKEKEEGKKNIEEVKKLSKELKNTHFNEINITKVTDNKWENEHFGVQFGIYSEKNVFGMSVKNHLGEDTYKFILSFLDIITLHNNYKKNSEFTFRYMDKDIANYLFKNSNEYYGLYISSSFSNDLYLTKNKTLFHNKIEEIKKDEDKKIIYFNNKTLGKELTDFDLIKLNNIKNKLKKISYNDITFESDSTKSFFSVILKDENLNNEVKENHLIGRPFFQKEFSKHKIYFGHFKNRFHAAHIKSIIQGIGLGYKIYKAFLKYQGYIISDEQTTPNARNMYYNLLKDDDVYYIMEKEAPESGEAFGKDSSKVLLLWKDNPNLERIVKLIRQHELSSGRKYEYDKELLKLIK